MANSFDIMRDKEAKEYADEGAAETDRRAGDQENAHHGAARRAHSAQDGDVPRLILHQHDQAGDNVQCGDENDQCQNREHDVALDSQSVEESLIALAPIDHDDRPLQRGFNTITHLVHMIGIVDKDLDDIRLSVEVEKGLGLWKRHEDECIVELKHADLENRDDRIGLDARRDAKGSLRAARRDDCDAVADAQAQMLSKAHADRYALGVVESIKRTEGNVAADARQALQVSLAHAASENARGIVLRGGERLPLDERQGQCNAVYFADSVSHSPVVGERRVGRLKENVPVEANDLIEKVVAETVHHRHHDDQGADAEHNAEKGEARDDRDRAMFAARAQIAKRHHPFEG